MGRSVIYQGQITKMSVIQNPDSYKDKLLKLIPAEIVAAFLTLKGILDASPSGVNIQLFQWIVFGGLLILTPIIYKKIYGVKDTKQLVVTTFAFVIWAFSIGSPIDTFFMDASGMLSPAKGIVASLLLVFYSLIAPLLLTK